jgi:hypothetical protein
MLLMGLRDLCFKFAMITSLERTLVNQLNLRSLLNPRSPLNPLNPLSQPNRPNRPSLLSQLNLLSQLSQLNRLNQLNLEQFKHGPPTLLTPLHKKSLTTAAFTNVFRPIRLSPTGLRTLFQHCGNFWAKLPVRKSIYIHTLNEL